MEIRSPKYWADLRAKYKHENLPPLEVVPFKQEKEAKALKKEDKLILLKNKHFNKGE